MNPGLLFNAQLALAAQHPALFGHYSGQLPTPVSPLQSIKNNRFSPYTLPGSSGSAFDAVTPNSSQRSLSSSPRPRTASDSPSVRPHSVSPTLTQGQQSGTVFQTNDKLASNDTSSELKNIENMVNGLDTQCSPNNGLDEKTQLIIKE